MQRSILRRRVALFSLLSLPVMLLGAVGMMIMVAATSILTIFLGLEMLSLALYVLCGFVMRRATSRESSMKYFLLSSFASAILLYGIALTYGATGSTSFAGISHYLLHRADLLHLPPIAHVPNPIRDAVRSVPDIFVNSIIDSLLMIRS